MQEPDPPAKRIKHDHNTTNINTNQDAALLQEINNDIQLAFGDINNIKQLCGVTAKGSAIPEPATLSLQHIADYIKTLQKELRSVVNYLAKNKEPSHNHDTLNITTINVIKLQLIELVPDISFMFLAQTCSSMFKLLAPQINEFPVLLPTDFTLFNFKYMSPTTVIVNPTKSIIPLHIKKIRCTDDFNTQFENLFQPTVTHITFGYSFNQRINFLPASISHLTLGYSFNCVISWPAVEHLTHLTYGHCYDSPIDFLPCSITHLVFGNNFAQALPSLPSNLQLLELGVRFMLPIETLPDSLRILKTHTMGEINYLPPSLTHFEHSSFTDNIRWPLPTSLRVLQITGGPELLDFSPLKHLTSLTIAGFYPRVTNLPNTLISLQIHSSWDGPPASRPSSVAFLPSKDNQASPLKRFLLYGPELTDSPSIPPSVTHLVVREKSDLNIPASPNLRHIFFSTYVDFPINTLANNITHLTLGSRFNHPLDKLPSTLTHLLTGDYFTHPVDHLPSSLSVLTLGYMFNKPLDSLPLHLSCLYVGYNFNHPISRLPPNLTRLSLGYSFNQDINNLPLSLTHLKLGVRFDGPMYNLPPRLQVIDLVTFYHDSIKTLSQMYLFPKSLAVVELAILADYGAGGRIKNYNEFILGQVDNFPINFYALRCTVSFNRKRIWFDKFSSKDFYNYYVAVCSV